MKTEMVDNEKYYELDENWQSFKMDLQLQQKIDFIRSKIPDTVHKILDVGCGNGLITNVLADAFKILGLDRSVAALKYLSVPAIRGNVNVIPIKTKSIDLVLCSEVLEHLDDDILYDSIQEIERVAKDYILLTVPNQEMLEKNGLKCPQCGVIFNVSYHLQSFDHARLRNLFVNFTCIEIHEIGKKWRRYVLFLLKIRQQWGNGWFKIPPNRKVMCPNCENTDFPKFKMNPIIFICDGVNKILKRRRPYWLLALYLRKR